MSEIWKTLGNEEREAYRSRARDDQKRYKAEQADKVSFVSLALVVVVVVVVPVFRARNEDGVKPRTPAGAQGRKGPVHVDFFFSARTRTCSVYLLQWEAPCVKGFDG